MTGQILGAGSAALKATQVHGYKIVWFTFLPGSVIAALGCALLKNPKNRMNWVTGASVSTRGGMYKLVTSARDTQTLRSTPRFLWTALLRRLASLPRPRVRRRFKLGMSVQPFVSHLFSKVRCIAKGRS